MVTLRTSVRVGSAAHRRIRPARHGGAPRPAWEEWTAIRRAVLRRAAGGARPLAAGAPFTLRWTDLGYWPLQPDHVPLTECDLGSWTARLFEVAPLGERLPDGGAPGRAVTTPAGRPPLISLADHAAAGSTSRPPDRRSS